VFFDEFGADRAGRVEAVSMGVGLIYATWVRADRHAPGASICCEPVYGDLRVKFVTDVLDSEHGETRNERRAADDADATRKFKGARWVLLKNRARAGSGACPPRELRAGVHPAVTFPGGEIPSVRDSRGDPSAECPDGLSGGLSRRGRHAFGEAARGRLGDRSGR